MGMGTLEVVTQVPTWLVRWAADQSVRMVKSARQQNEVHCLAELCHCLDHADEGCVFHPPFLVVKGRTAAGGSRLYATKLSAAELEDFRRGRPVPEAVGEFVRSLRPGWKKFLGVLAPTRRPVTARELPPILPLRGAAAH